MLNDTCVYIHTRLDGVVFYVGIGNPKRPYSLDNRNPHWHRTTAKHAYSVTVLHENLSWDEACKLEIELIAKYRAISGDKLCNMSLGGDGTRGVIPSEETRARLSVARKGKTPMLGKTHSEEVRAKMSAAQKNRPPMSEETRAKMLKIHTGAKRSEETRAKISEVKKGNTIWTCW